MEKEQEIADIIEKAQRRILELEKENEAMKTQNITFNNDNINEDFNVSQSINFSNIKNNSNKISKLTDYMNKSNPKENISLQNDYTPRDEYSNREEINLKNQQYYTQKMQEGNNNFKGKSDDEMDVSLFSPYSLDEQAVNNKYNDQSKINSNNYGNSNNINSNNYNNLNSVNLNDNNNEVDNLIKEYKKERTNNLNNIGYNHTMNQPNNYDNSMSASFTQEIPQFNHYSSIPDEELLTDYQYFKNQAKQYNNQNTVNDYANMNAAQIDTQQLNNTAMASNYMNEAQQNTMASNYMSEPQQNTTASNYMSEPQQNTTTSNYMSEPQQNTMASNSMYQTTNDELTNQKLIQLTQKLEQLEYQNNQMLEETTKLNKDKDELQKHNEEITNLAKNNQSKAYREHNQKIKNTDGNTQDISQILKGNYKGFSYKNAIKYTVLLVLVFIIGILFYVIYYVTSVK